MRPYLVFFFFSFFFLHHLQIFDVFKKKLSMCTPKFSASYMISMMPEDMRRPVEERWEQLRTELYHKTGLPLRDDSRLAWCYATNTLGNEWSLQRVLDDLVWTSYLHEKTTYPLLKKEVLPVVKQNVQQQHFGFLRNKSQAETLASEYVDLFVVPLHRIRAFCEQHPDQKYPSVQTAVEWLKQK
jgi:hypothetical protein